MIGPLDTLTLARTKIRSKRLRLLITTIVSALVFGVLAGVTVLVDGMGASLTRFAQANLGERFLVSGGPNFNAGPQAMFDPYNPDAIKQVEDLNKTYLAERKAAATEYGITDYDPRSEIPPFIEDNSPGVPAEFRRQINPQSIAYQRYVAAVEAQDQGAPQDLAAFTALVEPLGATEVYQARDLSHLQLTYLVNGQEDLSGAAPPTQEPAPATQTALATGQFTMLPDSLVAPFMTAPADAAPTGIPVLISADEAMLTFDDQLGLPKRPSDTASQVSWFTQVRDRVRGSTFTSCYRNEAERARIEQTRSQLSEIAAGRGNADFVKPPVIYALPTTPCGMVTVVEDTRTARQRALDTNRESFEARFVPPQEPRAELVTFEVAGLMPASPAQSSGVDAVLASLVGVNYGFAAIVPETSWAALPAELKHESLLTTPAPSAAQMPMYGPPATFIASFPTIEQAKTAVRQNSCMMSWTPECETMPFALSTYGTNYLAVDDITTQARPLLIVLFAIAFGIATIIIWAMMGRVIADSRRETAVFRAIGAKRSDIMAVYLTYSLWVALRIVVVAALIAAAIAGFVQFRYADRATDIAQLAYAVFTPEPRFSFIGLRAPLLWGIFSGIIVMSLVAITPPLLRNIRRNPIKDMRDE